MNKKFIIAVIDRFENDSVVLEADEGKYVLTIPFHLLPDNSKEGDFLKITIEIDEQGREKQEREIKKLRKKLET